MPPRRTLKKIPGKVEDKSVIHHEELGRIISIERRDIVADTLKVFLKFMKEVNMMANFGNEEIDWDPSKDEDLITKIAPLPKDVHPRQIGIAFFSFAGNVVANWEDAYLRASVEYMNDLKKREKTDMPDEHPGPEEQPKTCDQTELPSPLQNESKCFQDAWDALSD